MSDLTILCVTEYGAHSAPFLCALEQLADDLDAEFVEYDGSDARCIEDVLEAAVASCPDGYILRLDDDELPTPEMRQWLLERRYRTEQHWCFPRLHLWPDAGSHIATQPLYPDLQTRLSLKSLSGGRNHIHVGSPHGTGTQAPVAIEHHKFLVRSLPERRSLLDRYERVQPGAGSGNFAAFSIPEDIADLEIIVHQAAAA